MGKTIFIFLFFIFSWNYSQKKNEYIYVNKDCVGLQSSMDIFYENKKVGVLSGVKAYDEFCCGKLEFIKGFKLVKSMRLYKVIPLNWNSYIKIDKDITNKSKLRIPFTDTIKIITLMK